jgi:hypothetical protein
MKLLFKRLFLVFGLVMVFASVIEQSSDNYLYESPNNSQVSMMQFDKDNNRDIGDAVSVFSKYDNKLCAVTNFFNSYKIAYQEPTLLVQHRPPKA